jgi:hypothetical protein
MGGLGLLAGLAAVLAALVLAGGHELLTERSARANNAVTRVAADSSFGKTPLATGFFAGVGLTSPL